MMFGLKRAGFPICRRRRRLDEWYFRSSNFPTANNEHAFGIDKYGRHLSSVTPLLVKATPKIKATRHLEYRRPTYEKTHKKPAQEPLTYRSTPLILAGITAFAISAYIANLATSFYLSTRDADPSSVPQDVTSRYDHIASEFDSSVDYMERLMSLPRLRRRLAQQAMGDVCEVSIGTGRNLSYYNWQFGKSPGASGTSTPDKAQQAKVTSFTAVDKSIQMLEIAHDKFSAQYPGIVGVRWVHQSAEDPLPPPPVNANERSGNRTDKKYDTIVQTMGLCSVADPVLLLKNLSGSVEQETGRILLLEHGRGTWNWVNWVLDRGAPRHADKFGCWWNRDIGSIIRESGLEVVSMKRKHFGTTWIVELKPKGGKVPLSDP